MKQAVPAPRPMGACRTTSDRVGPIDEPAQLPTPPASRPNSPLPAPPLQVGQAPPSAPAGAPERQVLPHPRRRARDPGLSSRVAGVVAYQALERRSGAAAERRRSHTFIKRSSSSNPVARSLGDTGSQVDSRSRSATGSSMTSSRRIQRARAASGLAGRRQHGAPVPSAASSTPGAS